MREIRTSGLMSGDGKPGVAEWPMLPRPSSTLLAASVLGFFEVGLILGARAVIQGLCRAVDWRRGAALEGRSG